MPFRFAAFALTFAFVLAVAACNSSVGASCTTPGSTDQCGGNAVCDADTKLGTVCLEICTQDSDCASAEQCSGVTGQLKACHSK